MATAIGDRSRDMLGNVDPTGVVSETQERRRFWTAARETVDAVDSEAVSRAVQRFETVADRLIQRIDELEPGEIAQLSRNVNVSIELLRGQLETADLDGAVAGLRDATNTIHQTVGALDVKRVNTLLGETELTMAELRAAVDGISQDLRQLIATANQTVAESKSTVADLPVAELKASLADLNATLNDVHGVTATLPETAQHVDAALMGVRTASYVATGFFLLAGACCLAWLVRKR